MEILKYSDVLSDEQISAIKSQIIQSIEESDSYGEFNENQETEIAFGFFVNGICLVYLNENQEYFNEVLGSYNTAAYAIDKKGNFISIELDSNCYCGLDLNKYNKQKDITLTYIRLKRILQINTNEEIDTDKYDSWFWNNKLQVTDKILFNAEYIEGEVDYEVDDGYYYILEDYDKKHFVSGILCPNYRGDLVFSFKGETSTFTNVLIGSQYLLLRSREKYDERVEYAGFDHCFPSILIDDVYEPRYGLFDVNRKKTIIHCGERECNGGYINGFVKLVFKNSTIYTFDKFDKEKNQGIPYRPQMKKPDKEISVSCVTGIRKYLPVNVIKEPYWYKEGYRTGLYAGPLYIIREGKNAGRNISWLKKYDPKTLIKYMSSGYIHVNQFEDFVKYSVFGEEKDKMWLAHDLHFEFEDISDASDYLYLSDFASNYFESCETKHEGETFEEIIGNDPKYLVALINRGNLYVNSDVFDAIREERSDDSKYLKQLNVVASAMNNMQEQIDAYEEECEERRRVEAERYWEEEERRYYENEGYRAAFEDDPDAEWNID